MYADLPRYQASQSSVVVVIDPVYTDLPRDQASESSDVVLVVTPRGGHVAFMEGLLVPNKVGYIQRLFSQFAAAVLDKNYNTKATTSARASLHQENRTNFMVK